MYMRLLEPDQISMPHKSGKRSYPYVKKLFKNPIDPAILAAIGHRFLANKKIKN